MATPDTVAVILISVLATDNLSEMDQRIMVLTKQKATDPTTGEPTRCGVSTETVLRRALGTILSEPATAESLSIKVSRHARKPVARFLDKGSDRTWTQFGHRPVGEPIERNAIFQNLHQLAMQLKDAESCEATSESDHRENGQSSLSSGTPLPANANASGTASKVQKGRRKSSVPV
jgi:hypothetical protein